MPQTGHPTDAMVRAFYQSREWARLRYVTKVRDGWQCTRCGAKPSALAKAKGRLIVDHIRKVRDYWHMRLHPSNVRTLCSRCDNIRHATDKAPKHADAGCTSTGQPLDPKHAWNDPRWQ